MKHSIVIAGLTVLVSVATACWAEKKETSDASANYLEHSIPSEAVKYLSYNISGFREIFTDDYRKTPVTLKGHLYLPKGEGPFPVVVLQHGMGSVENSRPWIRKIVPVLNKNQLGAFVADSYSMRKAGMNNVENLSFSSRVLDGFQALKALSKYPKVDAKRIGIQGYSYGGMVALFTSYQELTDQLAPGLKYAAHMPVYPGCDLVIRHVNHTASPVEMVLAELDDYAPVKDCIENAPTIGGALKIYEGAHHGFINARTVKRLPEAHFVNCKPGYITESGNWFYNNKERYGPYLEIMSEIYGECGGQGVTVGGTKHQQAQLIEDTVRFFRAYLVEKD